MNDYQFQRLFMRSLMVIAATSAALIFVVAPLLCMMGVLK